MEDAFRWQRYVRGRDIQDTGQPNIANDGPADTTTKEADDKHHEDDDEHTDEYREGTTQDTLLGHSLFPPIPSVTDERPEHGVDTIERGNYTQNQTDDQPERLVTEPAIQPAPAKNTEEDGAGHVETDTQ